MHSRRRRPELIRVLVENNEIVCEILIVRPKSKIRIRKEAIHISRPRNEKIKPDYYIEWQISYQKEGRYVELGEIIMKATEIEMICRCDIENWLGKN